MSNGQQGKTLEMEEMAELAEGDSEGVGENVSQAGNWVGVAAACSCHSAASGRLCSRKCS